MRLRGVARRAFWKVGIDVRVGRTLNPTQLVMLRNERDDEHMEAMLASVLRPDSNCIDVGAHVGFVTRVFIRLAPAGHHIAIEPLPELAKALVLMFPEVDVHECAVGARAERVSFTHVIDAPFLSGVNTTALATYASTRLDVGVRTLDEIVDGRKIDLVKIDVEGAELDVLRGGGRTIESSRPVILFEHTRIRFDVGLRAVHGPLDLEFNQEIHRVLTQCHGYRIFDLDGAGPLDAQEFQRLYETGERFNFIATP